MLLTWSNVSKTLHSAQKQEFYNASWWQNSLKFNSVHGHSNCFHDDEKTSKQWQQLREWNCWADYDEAAFIALSFDALTWDYKGWEPQFGLMRFDNSNVKYWSAENSAKSRNFQEFKEFHEFRIFNYICGNNLCERKLLRNIYLETQNFFFVISHNSPKKLT